MYIYWLYVYFIDVGNCLLLRRDDFRKTYKEAHPDNKKASLVIFIPLQYMYLNE